MKRRLLNYDSTPKFSVIKTATAKGSASSVATITGIPTDGSVSLIVVSTVYTGGGTLSDTSSNAYSGATPHTSTGIITKIFYMPNPIVTSSMTFTFSAAFGAIAVMVLTGNPSSPNPNLDQQNGNNGTGTSLSSNSVTPTTNNQFIVAGAATGNPSTGTPPAVSGYTLLNVPFAAGGNQGLVTYYQVQTAATATSVTFSGPSITYFSAGIASFIN